MIRFSELGSDFNDYQYRSRSLARYPNIGNNFVYPVLGLSGESGEVSEKIKKILRDKNGLLNDEDRVAILKELGDVLWYIAQMAAEIGYTLEEVALANLEKLYGRLKRGTLHGSGDDR